MNTVADQLSIVPKVAELLVPEGLVFVKFESCSRVAGVSPYFCPTDQASEPTMYTCL